MNTYKAILADDEEHLRIALRKRLEEVWPELNICGEASNGLEAISLIESMSPDIAFLDIKMPGKSGLEVASKTDGTCWVVFVTAFDQYAIEAFENEAIDYLLKPVEKNRLSHTVSRLQKRLTHSAARPSDISALLQKVISQLPHQTSQAYLKWIKVQIGDSIKLISTDDVFCFKAADKYTQVFYTGGETLINTPIKTLTKELDPDSFWQVHRSTIVKISAIARVRRSFTGRHILTLEGVGEPVTVSRPYAHLFKI